MKKQNIEEKKHRERVSLTGQDRQDAIFQKMSAQRKLEIGAQLWQLAKIIAGDKINYGTRRSKTSFNRD